MSHLFIALRTSLVTLLLVGVAYPLGVTVVGQLIFPREARGSLIHDANGDIRGSRLLGQAFTHPAYFQGRPSANAYDPLNSGGSNLGPSAAKLVDRVRQDMERLRRENPDASGPVPVELVTASASGLDPHLSPQSARWQLPRVAKARGVDPSQLEAILSRHEEGRTFGFLGEPTVNVLELNLALDQRFGQPIPK